METYSLEITRELAREVELTVRALPGRADGTPPRAGAILAFAGRTAWQALRESGYHVIHGGDMAIWPLTLLAKLRSPKAAVVLTAHGTDVSFAQRRGIAPRLYRIYMHVGALMLRRASVLANSNATAERAKALGFKKVPVIPLGTRPLTSSGSPKMPGNFLLFAGRLVRRKGCAWFTREVLPLLPPEITLTVAGTIWDSDEKAALESERITYLGAVGQERLGQLMGEALCVVVPNIAAGRGHFEGFGLVAPEAAMSGGVVVASRMDGFLDSVLDGETGFLVEPQSAPAWAAKILEIAGWTADQRRVFINAAAARAKAHFTWSRVARETLDAYRS